MPHLTASALLDDPEGLALLRSTLVSACPPPAEAAGTLRSGQCPAAFDALRIRPAPRTLGRPLEPHTRPPITSHQAREP